MESALINKKSIQNTKRHTLFLINLARCANFNVLNVSREQLQVVTNGHQNIKAFNCIEQTNLRWLMTKKKSYIKS